MKRGFDRREEINRSVSIKLLLRRAEILALSWRFLPQTQDNKFKPFSDSFDGTNSLTQTKLDHKKGCFPW